MSATVSEYRRGTRVVLNEDIPGVPEGTPGKCGRGLGFAIRRYRVRFDNDVEAMSVAHSKLVPEGEWPQFLAKRAREAIEAAQAKARAAEARAAAAEARGLPAGSDDGADAPTEAPAPQAPASDSEGDDGGGDPRLAALMARSAGARAATGVAAPTDTTPPETAAAPTPEPAASTSEASAPTAPASSEPPSGPPRVELPEFIPGPEVEPDYAPGGNRVSDLLKQVRSQD